MQMLRNLDESNKKKMRALNQLTSQVSNILLFRRLFRIDSLLKTAFAFPVEYYFGKGGANPPLSMNFLVTSRCNLKCQMCHFSDAKNSCSDILSIRDIENLVREVVHIRPSFFLSGGEPFLREDILDIIRIIKREGMLCGLCTNGTTLNEDIIEKLIKLDLDSIVFSLHGKEEIHDSITGAKGSYRSLVENLKIMCRYSRRPVVIINCAVSETNINSLEEVVKIGEKLSVDGVRFEHLNFLTDTEIENHNKFWAKYFAGEEVMICSHRRDSGRLKNEGAFLSKLNEVKSRKHRIPVLIKPRLSNPEIKTWYSGEGFRLSKKCFFVWGSVFIGPNGDIYPCQFIMYKLGNIKNTKFQDIWNSKKYIYFRSKLREGLFPACMRCCKL